MSTPFYDLASLVVVPSGYKASKVYAQKPLTTDGQLTFSRASTATRVNSAGLIETVSSNVPRLDYLGSTCPKLQLEPSRTNLLQRSSEFGTSPWATAAATITADSVTSPDGTTNADTLTASGTGVQSHNVRQLISTTSGTVYAFSVFVKKGNTDWIMLRHDNGGTLNYFNINTGTKGSADASATIVPYGNGWYRCTVFHTGTGSNGPEIYLAVQNGSNTFEAAGQYAYIYGAQYEAGAYATSYIPTTTAAVTRLADTMSKTLVNSNSNFSLFLELDEAPLANGSGDWLALAPSTALGRAFMYSNSFGFADAYGAAASVVDQRKFAWTQISSTTAKVFSNGVLRSTGTGGSYSNPFNLFSINANYLDKPVRIKQIIFFDAPITDAQAIELTTL